jgi:hypothetical protein
MKKYVYYITLVIIMFAAGLGQILPPVPPQTKIVMQVKKGRKRKDKYTKIL